MTGDIAYFFARIRTNIRALTEDRASFAIGVVGMMLSNLAFLVSWVLYVRAFGAINGWGVYEVVVLQGFIALAYGIAHSVFFGAFDVRRTIYSGAFDSALLTPRSLFAVVLSQRTSLTAFGDIVYGVTLMSGYAYIASLTVFQVVMLFSLIVPATLVFIGAQLATSSIAFYLRDADALMRNLVDMIMFPGMFAGGAIQGSMRFFLTFIIPALVVGIIPVEVVTTQSFSEYILVWLLGVLWLGIGVLAFTVGARHYESGNTIGAQ